MTSQSSFQSHSQLGSNIHYISFFWREVCVNFICTLQSHFLEASDFHMGKVTVLSLFVLQKKQALFLRIPTTVKDSEIMAIFPFFVLTISLPLLSLLMPSVSVQILFFIISLWNHHVSVYLCSSIVLVYKLSRQFYSLAYCQS